MGVAKLRRTTTTSGGIMQWGQVPTLISGLLSALQQSTDFYSPQKRYQYDKITVYNADARQKYYIEYVFISSIV